MQPHRLGSSQTVAYDGSVATSNGVSETTTVVRVLATTPCFIKFGVSPTATSADTYLPANVPEYIKIKGGHKVAAIKVADAGNLYVTEVSN